MPDSNAVLRLWVDRLKSPDPEMREASIKELDVLGDSLALPALAEVFATDPEPLLRALAQAAGKSIYYRAIRRTLEADSASDEERRRAAEILAQARDKKLQHNKRDKRD